MITPPLVLKDLFAESHDLNRWNLQDIDDAWKLYYTMNVIEARLFDIYMLQYRNSLYAKSHTTFGEYWAAKMMRNIIFPYTDAKTDWVSATLNKAKRTIDELESNLEIRREP